MGGGGSSKPTQINTQGQSGKVTQGAISGATVWADNITKDTSDIRFKIDSDETSTQTTTGADGTFTLPVQPNYKYVIISQGGTDSITGLTATTMLAPAGAKSVSALTTLVALDPSGKLATAINALLPDGKTFDDDLTLTGGLTPAAMVAITSIESAVTTFNQTVQKAETQGAITPQQQNNINLTVYSQIATTFAGLTSPSQSLSNTQSLAINLQSALTTAAGTITTNNSNITLNDASTIASSIANNAVATSAIVVGNATDNSDLKEVTADSVQSESVDVSTNSTVTETTVMNSSNTKIVSDAVNNVSTADAVSVITTSTPSTYTPPVIAVANNPTITAYQLSVSASGSVWNVNSFKITFSDDMVATTSGDSFGNSVLNPLNYQFSQTGCSPTSYSSRVVTFSCGNLTPGTFVITVNKSTTSFGGVSSGVWASATSLGLLADNSKTFTLPTITGSTGGNNLDLF